MATRTDKDELPVNCFISVKIETQLRGRAYMKSLITLVLVFSVGVAYAGEKILFLKTPPGISTSQASEAVQKAALRRKWKVSTIEDNKLQVKLNHHDYEALLIFSFSDKEIRYEDLTTFYEMDDSEQENGESVPAPDRWVNNLKRDAGVFLREYQLYAVPKEKFSHEDIKLKLESLKKMYEQKLITESEYAQKKKEVLSRY